jgi:predicted TIM-barrel fold metal-dependent hydrolase
MNAVVADALRGVGLDRVVYGTDWDAIPLALYLDEIREALPMTEEEIRDLLDDPAPYLEP